MSDAEQRNRRLAVALDLAARNIPVFPFALVGDDKVPVIEDWPNAASTDPDQITAWFGNGSDYLIGVPTGERSGMDILDVDPRHRGDEWYKEHESELPPTRTHVTRRRGAHLVLQHHEGMRGSQGRIGPGIDVLGDGSFVAWWPAEGLPVANADLIAPWPEWLIPLALRPRMSDGGDVPLERRLPPSAAAVVELIDAMPNPLDADRDAYIRLNLSARGCQDALAETGQLTPEDYAAIMNAAIAWSERWEGYKGTDEHQKWDDDWRLRSGKLAGWEHLHRLATELTPGLVGEEFRDASLPPRPKSAGRFRILRRDDILTIAEPRWLIPDVLVESAFTVVHAPYDSFKSFIAQDWACCLATGTPWCGRPVKQCDTLYIVGEASSGIRARLEAWEKHHGIEATGFAIVPLAVNLMHLDQVKEFARAVLEERRANGFDPGLVVIDTLHRSMSGGDENSAKDMAVVIGNIASIQRTLGCSVVLIHHAGKDLDRGARGSSAIPADSDSSLSITRQPGTLACTLRIERHKDASSETEFPLRLIVVELPVNPETLAARSSLVVVADDRPKAEKLNATDRHALRILAELIEAEGVTVMPHGKVVEVARWEVVCEDRQLSDAANKKHRTQAFRRAVKNLSDTQRISIVSEMVRILGDAEG